MRKELTQEEVNTLGEEWELEIGSKRSEIEALVSEAYEKLSAAEKLADESNFAFSFNGDTYVSAGYMRAMKKFNDKGFWDYELGHQGYDGWQNSNC